jgi:deoxyribonuclease-4
VRLGAHESGAGALATAFELAKEDGAESLQIFTRSSRQWAAKPLAQADIDGWRAAWELSDIGTNDVMIHTSYLINLCAPDEENRVKSVAAFTDEIVRSEQLGVRWLNTHPGAVKEQSESWGCVEVAATVDRCLEASGAVNTMVVIENTAGQGSNIGYRFEHLRDIIGASRYPDRIAVCIDTCHAFAGGYDLGSAEACEEMLQQLKQTVGWDKVAAFHLNGSMGGLGNRKDRHDQIGVGGITAEAFAHLVNHPAFANTPAMLETPPLESGERSFRTNLDRLKAMRRPS